MVSLGARRVRLTNLYAYPRTSVEEAGKKHGKIRFFPWFFSFFSELVIFLVFLRKKRFLIKSKVYVKEVRYMEILKRIVR